jgi:amino acid transporter
MSSSSQPTPPGSNRVRIVVASTVMLTFISYWRAAAVVLNDMGSSAFYAGSIAEQAVGKAAPWFVLAVMFFAVMVRGVYIESCSMFVRGGVYRVVKEALGSRLAKVSVSALMFDYILTGPISGVSAGHYISGLINDLLRMGSGRGLLPEFQIPELTTTILFAIGMTIFYWWQNVKGIEESSDKALKVMKIVTVMVTILLGWSIITLFFKEVHWPPAPVPENLTFSEDALGFLKHTDWHKTFGLLGILMAFGHSILAMSGEETLAQVNREIGAPKLQNLKRVGIIMSVFTIAFTGFGTLLAAMIVPDDVRVAVYGNNLMAGLAMHLHGPEVLRVLLSIFVVFCGFLMLSGAINTAIVGANGVMNRISEDGVLTDWFRRPHKKFGTSYRIINLIVGLQIVIILASGGDMFLLGEAYAFGVLWSFTFNAAAMVALRFKYKGPRGWKMPPNLRIGKLEIPIALGGVFIILLTVASVNLLTKSVATVAGIIFTAVFFVIFTVSERINRKKFAAAAHQMQEHFQLQEAESVEREAVAIRPNNILVTVRDYNTLTHLKWVLERTDTEETDVVVLAARMTGGSGQYDLAMDQIFSDYEQTLFTRAVSVAESYGKHISLLVVPAGDVWSAIVQTANSLESSAVVAGLSSKMAAQDQAFNLGRAWEAMPQPKRQFLLQIVRPDFKVDTFTIGPHEPRLKPEDVALTHRLWLVITSKPGMSKIHHADIVTLGLTRLARDFAREPEEIIKELRRGQPPPPPQLGKGEKPGGPPMPPVTGP